MSARNWAIAIWNQAFDTRRVVYSWTTSSITLDGDGAVTPTLANVQNIEWHVTPNENSLDATWEGDSNGSILNIQPQDRVIIYTLGYRTGETTTTYYPRFRGICSIPANQNHTDGLEHQYRALGISRLLETADTGENYPIDEGQDLAADVADTIIDNLPDSLPGGITYSTFSAIGVTNTGKINPGSADLAQNLDALVTLCKSGSVDAVWGVKPDGSIFFEELNTDTLEVQEGAAGTVVEWTEPQADEIITAVRWIIADGNQQRTAVTQVPVDLSTPDQLTYLADSGITTFGTRTVPMTAPGEAAALVAIDSTYTLQAGTLQTSWDGSTEDGTASLDNSHDGDPDSYSVITPDGSGNVRLRASFGGDLHRVRLITVSLTADPDSDAVSSAYAYVMTHNGSGDAAQERANFHNLWGAVKARGLTSASAEPKATQGLGEVTTELVFGDRARGNPAGYVELVINVATSGALGGVARVAIADFKAFKLNDDTLDALAEQEYRFPQEAALNVRAQGQVTPGGLVNVTRLTGSVLSDLPVEAISTSISGVEGVRTTLVVGPRTPPAISEEVHRIARRDRLAALAGAKAGLR